MAQRKAVSQESDWVTVPESEWKTVPESEWKTVTEPPPRFPTMNPAAAPSVTTPPAQPKSLWDEMTEKVAPIAPIGGALTSVYNAFANPRTAFQVGGGLIGGALGSASAPFTGPAGPVLGAAAGTSIGESLYQLGGHTGLAPSIFGEPPQSSEEAAQRHRELLQMDLLGYGAMKAAPALTTAIEAPVRFTGQAIREALAEGGLPKKTFSQALSQAKASPQTLMTRAAGSAGGDIHFQEHITPGLKEMKAAEQKWGTPITDVRQGVGALEMRTGVNNQAIDEIVTPQESIRVPGSRAPVREAEIAAIPEDIRLHDPDRYQQLVQKASERADDYTIGELNTLRKELNATQSPYYGKDVSGQLTMDAGVRAMDIARGKAVRDQFYTGLDRYGLGGGDAAREINSRIGSIIHMKDALQPRVNKSMAEMQSWGETLGDVLRHPVENVRNVLTFNRGWTPDKNLKIAMRRWNLAAEPYANLQLEPPLKRVTGTQPPLFPAMPPTEVPQQGLFSQEFQGGRVPTSMSPEGYASQLRQQEIYRQGAAKPPSGQMGLETTAPPGVFSSEFQGGRIPSPLTPAGYVEQLQQQRAWNAGAPILPPGQLDIQKGIPPKVFGIEQQFPTGPQQSFSFGNQGITPTSAPQAGQQQFAFPKTERELWIEEFFKKNPHLDIRKK